jgi:hypothetical protein
MPIVTELWTVWITGSLRKVAFVLGLVIHATLHAQPSASSVVPCNLEAGRITFTFPHHPTSLRKFYLTPCWTFFFFLSEHKQQPLVPHCQIFALCSSKPFHWSFVFCNAKNGTEHHERHLAANRNYFLNCGEDLKTFYLSPSTW